MYRIKNNFSHRDVKLAVVVQKMIFPEKSGVMFTAHPLTGHRHTLTIDASFGLGEAIVAGLVTPDTYSVDKRTRKIIERKISNKEIAVFPRKEGGTLTEKVSQDRAGQPALTGEEILELTSLGCKIESHYGHPQDIEWAIEKKQIYLLQTRPITSLYPIEGLEYPEGTLGIFFSLARQQGMLRAMTPLGMSTIKILLPLGKEKNSLETKYVRSSGNRLFLDVTLPLKHFIARRGIFALLSQIDALAPEALKQAMKRPEFKRSPRLRPSFSHYRAGVGFFRRIMADIWWRDLTGTIEKVNKMIEEYVFETRARLETIPIGKERLQIMVETLQGLFPYIIDGWLPEFIAGNAATHLLKKFAKRWLSPADVEKLVTGIPGNVVNEMNMSIGDLADIIRDSPELVKSLEQVENDASSWIKQVEKMEGSKTFLDAWNDFISRYGMRCPAELEISTPRWYEDPTSLLMVIKEALQREKGHHRKKEKDLINERELAIEKLIRKARKGIFGRLRVRIYKRLYKTMLNVGGLREHHKYLAMRIFAILKENLKEIARKLVDENKIHEVDDVWYLTWPELFKIWDDAGTNWKEIIDNRRKEMKKNEKLKPPMVITSDGETPIVQYKVEDAPEGALIGNPVSPGVVEGMVHVIHDPQNETLSPGEILVAEFTDPGWTPLFINAKGLILEIGGALTHGAVVAREYGIPAVVGVQDATKKLQTGQKVRLDGNRGIIEII